MPPEPPITEGAETAEDPPADWKADPKLLFAVIETRLKREGGQESHVSAEQLVRALRANAGVPLPPAVLDYVCRMLLGEIPKPRGRRPDGMNELIRLHVTSGVYHDFYDWLVRRKARFDLKGWHPIRDADWWQGPPSERAARMTAHKLRKPLRNVDHRHILNMLSKHGLLSSSK